jgi:hypothetical protein
MRTIKGLLIGGVRKYRTFGITQITFGEAANNTMVGWGIQ